MPHWKAALRSIARRPAFTITTVIVLAFGIAANSALFSIVDTVLLKPLPYPNPNRIVQVMEANPAGNERVSLIAPGRLDDWGRLARSFEAISGSYSENVTDTSLSEPERLAGRRVAPGYFGVFGSSPLIGRAFLAGEEKFNGPRAAVISEGLWTRRYHRNPGVLGRLLVLSGAAYPIVGVMPAEFAAPAIEVWLPAQISPFLLRMRDARFFTGVGRMKPGVTIEQARSDLQAVCRRLGEQYPKTDKDWSALVTDYKERQIGSSSQMLTLMFGAVAMLLLILCANIAGLLLGQLQRRERELAIRSSLGATRAQIAAVVLREVAVLASLSGTLGLALAFAGVRVCSRLFAQLPRMQELRFDWRIALFTTAVSAATALVFGMIPALQATRRNLNFVLAQGGRAQIGGRHRVQQVLVAAQFTVTLVLLAGAGLLLRSYHNLTRVQPGFATANVITFHVGAAWGEDRNKIGQLQMNLLSELQQLPGVEAAGMTNFLPASGATLRAPVSIDGLADAGDQGKITAGGRSVSAGYLRALRVPLLQGALCPDIRALGSGPAKALVNKRFVEVAGGSDLIGRHLSSTGAAVSPEIVGVVGNVKEDALNTPVPPYVYFCVAAGWWPDPEYVVATQGDPRPILAAVRQVVRRLAPQRAIFGVSTIAEHLDRTLDQPRINAGLLGVFALSALVSAALGLYGLVMLMVAARSTEIGVRIALGARPGQIVTQVVGEALRPLGIAIAAGAGLALLVLRAFRYVLYEVAPADVLTFACVCALLVSVAATAAVIPGRRAAKIDPVEALRSE
jgi:putative ABC transport system permease protein